MFVILIILVVGIIVGSWMFFGIVLVLIYYGLDLLNLSYFLILVFFISVVIFVVIGIVWGFVLIVGIVFIFIGN